MPSLQFESPSRRELLALAAALAGTTLTAGLAIAGLNHRPSVPVQVISTVSQVVTPTAPATRREPQEPGG